LPGSWWSALKSSCMCVCYLQAASSDETTQHAFDVVSWDFDALLSLLRLQPWFSFTFPPLSKKPLWITHESCLWHFFCCCSHYCGKLLCCPCLSPPLASSSPLHRGCSPLVDRVVFILSHFLSLTVTLSAVWPSQNLSLCHLPLIRDHAYLLCCSFPWSFPFLFSLFASFRLQLHKNNHSTKDAVRELVKRPIVSTVVNKKSWSKENTVRWQTL